MRLRACDANVADVEAIEALEHLLAQLGQHERELRGPRRRLRVDGEHTVVDGAHPGVACDHIAHDRRPIVTQLGQFHMGHPAGPFGDPREQRAERHLVAPRFAEVLERLLALHAPFRNESGACRDMFELLGRQCPLIELQRHCYGWLAHACALSCFVRPISRSPETCSADWSADCSTLCLPSLPACMPAVRREACTAAS